MLLSKIKMECKYFRVACGKKEIGCVAASIGIFFVVLAPRNCSSLLLIKSLIQRQENY